jgi:formylglycine-generating enzyme required for sulfatase activity
LHCLFFFIWGCGNNQAIKSAITKSPTLETPLITNTISPKVTLPQKTPTKTSTPTPIIVEELYDFENEKGDLPFGFVEDVGATNSNSQYILSNYKIDDQVSHSGKKSLKLYGDKKATVWAIIQRPILPNYKSIEVSYYIKGNNIHKEGTQWDNCFVGFIISESNLERKLIVNRYGNTFNWERGSITLNERDLQSINENNGSIEFVMLLSMTGEFWVDDIKFTYEIPPQTEQTNLKASNTPNSLPTRITDSKGVEMALIPAGAFKSGIDEEVITKECNKLGFKSCVCGTGFSRCFGYVNPPITSYLENYYIDLTEVTNSSYARCVEEGYCDPPKINVPGWYNYFKDPQYAQYPVVFVNYSQAQNYCRWRGKRLPTEYEWEKAARGKDGRLYPWGNEFDQTKIQHCDKNCIGIYYNGIKYLAPVGSNEYDVSPFGIFDLGGNVAEWVEMDRPVTMGGNFDSSSASMLSMFIMHPISNQPEETGGRGFRCAYQPPTKSSPNNVQSTPIDTSYVAKKPIQGLPSRITDEYNIEMVLIPAGEVQLGSSKNDKVFLDNYYIDVYEVTNEKFVEFLNHFGNRRTFEVFWINEYENSDIYRNDNGQWIVDEENAKKPANGVSFYGANAFCTWRYAALPTEAQWIKAARGGLEGNKYPWGNEKPDCDRANFNRLDSSGKYVPCVGHTTTVGSYPPNGYGLYDMAGNVEEWVSDIFGRKKDANMVFPIWYRILHGGTLFQSDKFLKINEFRVTPGGSGFITTGFRCVRLP